VLGEWADKNPRTSNFRRNEPRDAQSKQQPLTTKCIKHFFSISPVCIRIYRYIHRSCSYFTTKRERKVFVFKRISSKIIRAPFRKRDKARSDVISLHSYWKRHYCAGTWSLAVEYFCVWTPTSLHNHLRHIAKSEIRVNRRATMAQCINERRNEMVTFYYIYIRIFILWCAVCA